MEPNVPGDDWDSLDEGVDDGARPPTWLRYLYERPPIWLALAIGGAFGVVPGFLIGRAFGTGWAAAGVVFGFVLGSITGLDMLLPRSTTLPGGEIVRRKGNAGPFRGAVYCALCFAIAAAGGIYFGDQESYAEFARTADGRVDCRKVDVYCFGSRRQEQTIADVRDADVDVHGGLMLRTSADLPSLVGGITGDELPAIRSYLKSDEATLRIHGPRWTKFVSPGFFLAAALTAWLSVRSARRGLASLAAGR